MCTKCVRRSRDRRTVEGMTHREANAAIQRALDPFFEGDDPGALVRTHGWLHIAEAVLVALRSLPVEQRMEAMGMVEVPNEDVGGFRWVEADR